MAEVESRPNVVNRRVSRKIRSFVIGNTEVNTGGPFLSPFGPSFGGYTHGTEQSRVVQILHELAHLLKNPEGTGWLIPDDGSDPKQSEKNTSTVMDHCKDQIDKVK